MISRVAESCFWLQRYMERVDNCARMLEVNLSLVLDVQLPVLERWRPLLVVAGEEPRFLNFHGEHAAEDGEAVQEYLTWDRQNPNSVFSSASHGRENARTIRETLSLEMWQTVNRFWLWMKGTQGRRLYTRDRADFYTQLKETAQLLRGICRDTMLHDGPYEFMILGMLLERAGQTARILDVKHHKLGPTTGGRESAEESAQWLAILRSCSATESFFKRGRPFSGPAVAEFLILERDFPRSILHCLDRARTFLDRIRPPDIPEIGRESADALERAVVELESKASGDIVATGMHEELSRIIAAIATVCSAVHRDYFDPQVRPTPAMSP